MDTTPPTTPDPRNRRIALAAVFALSLAFGAWGLWRVVAPTSPSTSGWSGLPLSGGA